ncbi:MAG: FadR/GntR family transcriptional regulator [[Clostridium] scindens]
MRNLLEVKAAQLAAEHADDAGRRRLSLLAEKISKAYEEQEEKEFLDYEMEFHRCVAQCSGNQVIYSMLETISNLMRRLSATGMTGVHQQEEIYQENQRIYSLILAGDKEGSAEAMREHMKRSTQRYHYI